MDLGDVIKAIKDVGFPIGVAIYLLVRFDRLMVAIIEAQAKELEVLYQLRDYMLYGKDARPRGD